MAGQGRSNDFNDLHQQDMIASLYGGELEAVKFGVDLLPTPPGTFRAFKAWQSVEAPVPSAASDPPSEKKPPRREDPTKASRGVEGHPPSSHLASGRSTPDSLIERMGGRQRSAGMSDAVSAAPKRASNVYGRLMKMQERSGGAATNSSPAQVPELAMASVASQGASGGGGSSSREAASSARTSGSSSRHLASGGVGSSLAPSVMNSTTNNSKRSSERRSFHACTASPRSNAATNTPISSARVTAGVRARGASPAPSVGMRSGQGSRRSSAHEASAGKRSTSTANQTLAASKLPDSVAAPVARAGAWLKSISMSMHPASPRASSSSSGNLQAKVSASTTTKEVGDAASTKSAQTQEEQGAGPRAVGQASPTNSPSESPCRAQLLRTGSGPAALTIPVHASSMMNPLYGDEGENKPEADVQASSGILDDIPTSALSSTQRRQLQYFEAHLRSLPAKTTAPPSIASGHSWSGHTTGGSTDTNHAPEEAPKSPASTRSSSYNRTHSASAAELEKLQSKCKKQEEEISRLCGHIAREPERVHVLKSTLATTEAERQKLETKVNDLEQLCKQQKDSALQSDETITRLRAQQKGFTRMWHRVGKCLEEMKQCPSAADGIQLSSDSMKLLMEPLEHFDGTLRMMLDNQMKVEEQLHAKQAEHSQVIEKLALAGKEILEAKIKQKVDQDHLEEIMHRSRIMERANQNLHDINAGLERDVKATSSEVAMLCKERFDLGEILASTVEKLSNVEKELLVVKQEKSTLEAQLRASALDHGTQLERYAAALSASNMDSNLGNPGENPGVQSVHTTPRTHRLHQKSPTWGQTNLESSSASVSRRVSRDSSSGRPRLRYGARGDVMSSLSHTPATRSPASRSPRCSVTVESNSTTSGASTESKSLPRGSKLRGDSPAAGTNPLTAAAETTVRDASPAASSRASPLRGASPSSRTTRDVSGIASPSRAGRESDGLHRDEAIPSIISRFWPL